jgi:hypothetical protein
MTDTFDSYQANPSSVPPLTRAIIAAMPTTMSGNVIGPCANDASQRAMLDALSSLETRVTTLEGA